MKTLIHPWKLILRVYDSWRSIVSPGGLPSFNICTTYIHTYISCIILAKQEMIPWCLIFGVICLFSFCTDLPPPQLVLPFLLISFATSVSPVSCYFPPRHIPPVPDTFTLFLVSVFSWCCLLTTEDMDLGNTSGEGTQHLSFCVWVTPLKINFPKHNHLLTNFIISFLSTAE